MVSFGLVYARILLLFFVGILLSLFGTTLLPLGRVHVVVVRVLSIGIPVLIDDPASAFYLGLEDCFVHFLVFFFSTRIVLDNLFHFFSGDAILHLQPCHFWDPSQLASIGDVGIP
jgi:hypothetical protein